MPRPTVFLSYSKHDADWRDRLHRFLKPLSVHGEVDIWADDRIDAGADWYEEIRVAIGRAAVGICLVTTDFLGTEFIAKQEIPDLLQRREHRGMKLVPLLIHDCPWKFVRWLRQLQIIPPKGVPLDRLTPRDQDAFLARLAEEIGEFLERWEYDLPAPGFAEDAGTAKAYDLGEEAPRRSAPLRRGAPRHDSRDPNRRPRSPRRGLALGEDVPLLLERGASFSVHSLAEGTTPTPLSDLTRLPETGAALFGRDQDLDRLDAAWDARDTRVVALVAAGGVGKTSLAVRWVRDLMKDPDRAPSHAFAWSFYSQGARGQAATGEPFIDAALRFFGDQEPESGSPWQKGERLAARVAAERTLLILDGLEPLQAPDKYDRGVLRDPGVRTLLKRLARKSEGLCLVTTREPVVDLLARPTTEGGNRLPLPGFLPVDLEKITPEAGRALLRHRRVVGTDAELEALAREFGPLALSLSLLGAWIAQQPGRHASSAASLPGNGDPLDRLLVGFEALLGEGRELDLFHMQGLFDRPATAALLAAVRGEEGLPGLGAALPRFTQEDAARVARESGSWGPWEAAVLRLRELSLLLPNSAATPDVLEAHPLLRERTAEKIRVEREETWREAHRRIYEHLCASVPYRPEDMAGLAPLYQAVAHGCLAGLHAEVRRDVYRDRILRGTGLGGFYSSRKLGAIGADLVAVACFFIEPWRRLATGLAPVDRTWLLNEAAYFLRALGRLAEAVEPMRAAKDGSIARKDWKNAAARASNLSELELARGEVKAAIALGEQAVALADRSGDSFERLSDRTTHADALHQAGRRAESRLLFEEAERLQAERQPEYPRLYSLSGFRFCDLLLVDAERVAWRQVLVAAVSDRRKELSTESTCGSRTLPGLLAAGEGEGGSNEKEVAAAACGALAGRVAQTLGWGKIHGSILPIALDHLTLSRVALYQAILDGLPAAFSRPRAELARGQFDTAVDGLRSTGLMDHLPRGLLTRALLRFLDGDEAGCRDDLDEAWEIAEPGPMRLFMADVLLTRARLFRDLEALAQARALIEKHGYGRRLGELEDAEAAARDWPEAGDLLGRRLEHDGPDVQRSPSS